MKAIACGILATSLTVSAFADVAYSSFSSTNSFNTGAGWSIGGSSEQVIAFQFTSAASGVLASVEYASFGLLAGDINILLYKDNADTIGDQIIGWGKSVVPGPSTIETLTNSFPSVSLTAGAKYWLELRGVSNGVYTAWNENDQGLNSNAYYWNSGGSGYTTLATSAFRVNTVPEPASMAALGLGALALVRKRRKSA